MRKSNFIAALMLCFGFIQAQDVSVRAILDTNKGLIGDQFTLRLMVEKPVNSWTVTFPVLDDSLINSIEIIEKQEIDTSIVGNKQILTQDLVITVFDTGFFEIPSLPFGISQATLTDTLNSLPLYFEIQAMKADSTIRDIKAIYKVPIGFREILPYVLGLLGLAILVWLVVKFLKNRPDKVVRMAEEVLAEPADVTALRDLSLLRKEKAWMNNRVKYHFSRISDILRIYIERRFKTLAMEQTTGEILNSLAQKNIDKDEKQRLGEILKLADLVKFAKAIPDPGESEDMIGQAESFVQNTKWAPAEEPVNDNQTL